MTTTIKITELTDIGANLASSTVLPVVNMSGTPTTQKTVLGNIANVILEGAGTDYSPVGEATLAGTVTTNAQPNITSVGSLTGLTVSNSSGVVNFSNTANVTLGAIGNLHISGGTAGQLLSTNGNGTLSWASDTTTYGNSNVANYLPTYTGNVGANWVIADYFSGNAHNLTYIPGANINGAVAYATTANSVAAANVSGLGNVALINKDGNASNVLYGNGVFAPVTGGDVQSKIANGTSNVTITPSNGPVVINVNGTEAWTFSDSGNLQTAGDIVGPAGANLTIYANAGVHEFTFGDDGTFYAPDNVVLGGNAIYIGPGANTLTGVEHEVLLASSNNFAYVQGVINNVSDNGSAEWVALGAKGNDAGGWAEVGFTSSGFGDANYTITGAGDGYVFAQSYAPGQTLLGGGGNLILATGNQGSVKDIIFGTGGFATSDIFGRISDSNNALELSRTGSSIKFYDGTELGVIEGANTFGLYNANATEFLLESGATAWSFNGTNGTTGFPTLTVDLHNGGNQTAQTLQFGDPSKQAVITGPTPAANVNAQRLIIQGQRGNGQFSEGGDVYVWAGDADTNGGDIKIYAGDADNVSAGYGGYINLDGGSGFDGGGQITVTGGYSANGPGGTVYVTAGNGADAGDLNLAGGQSSTAGNDGGNANLSGGYGQNNGGAVTITGGQSALGLANYGNVRVESGASAWTFDNTGNLVLAGGNSVVQSIANSSLDPLNPNVSTMILTPDSNYTSQILVLDPTAPGHIHLRAYAFSNIDEPAANIFLGGEDTSFEVTSGANNQAVIHSGGNNWTFGNNGTLTLPGEGIIQSINDTVILQSMDANSNVYSARLGTNGGLYFATTQYPQGWLDITNNSGNANITAASGTAGGAGKHIYINAGAADQSDFYTTAGGNINITGGLGAFNDGGGGGPGGAVNITSGNSSDPAGHAGNVNITAGNNDWVFDYNGNLTLPGNLVIAGNTAMFSSDVALIQATDDLPLISLSSGANGGVSSVWLENQGDVANSNIAAVYTPLPGTGTLRLAVGSNGSNVYLWDFDNTGNLTLPGNTFSVNYANGTQVSLGGSSVAEASFSIQSSNFNATAGSRYGVNTSGGAVTATLPATPATGVAIFFADAGGAYASNNLTIDPNGGTIMGASGNMTVSTNNQSVGLFYNGTTWRTYNAG